MAELSEAFKCIKFKSPNISYLEYFFTQRNLKEEHEFLDVNMNRQNKQVNIIYNFLVISIPNNELKNIANKIDVYIFGDEGFCYKGTIISYIGELPNFTIPVKGDKKLFVHLIYSELNKENEFKEYIRFIDVPKRFQSSETDNSTNNKLKNDS